MNRIPEQLANYHRSGKPLVCELDVEPWRCEFWPVGDILTNNNAYQVARHAPGLFGFGSNGGGEMFAIAPSGGVVCVPFIGMGTEEALPIAESWATFETQLKHAP